MKTKHLFLATALMASFAACTNEEIVSDVQQNVATGRPTVENVKLTFGENVDSRLVYNKGYKWESTDVIGALLMDQPRALPSSAAWAEKTWTDKYLLTSTIHTSYPFTYNVEEGTWGTPAKMLEGNYFFAFPWESYDGNRQVAHSLIGQEQVGVEADVRAESYANNQFFIGYDRIIAGTQAEEALNNVTMTPVLGAIQLQIVNTGTQDYHINKVVLKGTQLSSVLTFDPTTAAYGTTADPDKYNRVYVTADNYFNSANYLGLEDEKDIYNADEDYVAEEALLAVVDKLTSKNDGFSQIYIKGTEEERLLEAQAGNTAYVLIMATPCEKVTNLTLDIYTDEGVVLGVNLTKINNEIKDGKSTAITSSRVKAIGPDVVNTIKVQIDDNSFNVPTVMNVYNENDLMQLIQWNANEPGAREVYAVLNKDLTLTQEMLDVLAINKSIELFIAGDHEVTLAAELDADILDAENLHICSFKESDTEMEYDGSANTDVLFKAPAIKVLGEIELTQTANKVGKITVAKDAELTINDKKVKNVTVDNYGSLTIGADTKYLASGTITNYADMIVVEEAIVKSSIVNNDELTIEGRADDVTNNKEGKITLGEEAVLDLTENTGLVITEDGAKVTGQNSNTAETVKGEIMYVDGAKVTAADGIIYREVEGAVAAEPTGTAATNVNAWYVIDDITLAANATIGMVKVDGDYDIEVDVPATGTVTLTITGNLEINGQTTTEGAIKAGSITVNEFGIWTNNGSVEVTTKNAISNEKGEIENNGSIVMPYGTTANDPVDEGETSTKFVAGEWDGDYATIKGAVTATALENVVNKAWTVFKSGFSTLYAQVGQNPYDVDKFVDVFLYPWGVNDHLTDGGATVTLLNSSNWNLDLTGYTEAEAKAALKAKLIANYDAFVAAVDKYVFDGISASTSTSLTTYVADYIEAKSGKLLQASAVEQDSHLYHSSDAAMKDLLSDIVLAKATVAPATIEDYKTNLKIYKNISTSTVKTALEKSTCGATSSTFEGAYAYIWNECNLVKAVAVWKKYGHVECPTKDHYNNVANYSAAVWNEAFVRWAAWAIENNETIKADLTTAGVTLANYVQYGNFTIEQFKSATN